VLVVGDLAPLVDVVGRLLEKEFMVAGVILDPESLVEQCRKTSPDVIVLDVSAGCDGFRAAARLHASGSNVPLVFLSVHEAPDFVRAGWAAGGLGFVVKRDIGWDLVPAIRAALRGRRYVWPAIEAQ
jgi:DNA-binding NarL/FixJ family response regulator